MSSLSSVLAGRTPPGVYRWHAAYDVADVRHTVEHVGWRFGYVDGWVFQSKAEFLLAVGEALALPDYYGRNLDALEECLADLDGPTVLLWDGWSPLARADDPAFRGILDVFAAGSDQLTVLLRGEGPEIDVPDLD
jgi:RNAse (barnase) inhibitor barstar